MNRIKDRCAVSFQAVGRRTGENIPSPHRVKLPHGISVACLHTWKKNRGFRLYFSSSTPFFTTLAGRITRRLSRLFDFIIFVLLRLHMWHIWRHARIITYFLCSARRRHGNCCMFGSEPLKASERGESIASSQELAYIQCNHGGELK